MSQDNEFSLPNNFFPEPVQVEPAFEEQLVVEAYPEVEVVYTEPAAEPVEEPAVVPVAEPKAKSKKVSQPEPVVYAEGEVVYLSSLVYEGYARNSRSIDLVQQRLIELGFYDAGTDEPGWFSIGTKTALKYFAGCADDEECNIDCKEDIEKLFAGTSVKVV